MSEENAQQPYLGNIAFWCADFDAMLAFYTKTLGLQPLSVGDRPRKWAFFGDNSFNFSLNEAPFTPVDKGWAKCPMNPALGEEWHPYITFYVQDLDAVITRCRENNVPLHSEEPFSLGEGFGRSIEVKDPDGNTVALTER